MSIYNNTRNTCPLIKRKESIRFNFLIHLKRVSRLRWNAIPWRKLEILLTLTSYEWSIEGLEFPVLSAETLGDMTI